MSPLAFGALCVSSLFTVVDPLGVAPVFASMTARADARARRRAALRACLTALVVLALFATSGSALLRLFGVTIEAFRIAGGILFGVLGLAMLRGESHEATSAGDPSLDGSIVPLGVPLIGGPGAMTTVMVLVGQAESTVHVAMLGAAVLIVLALTYAVLAAAPALLARLGPTGVALTTRVMGLVVLVIGVQFVIDGVVPVVRQMMAPARASLACPWGQRTTLSTQSRATGRWRPKRRSSRRAGGRGRACRDARRADAPELRVARGLAVPRAHPHDTIAARPAARGAPNAARTGVFPDATRSCLAG